jgi:hypothetical protein
MLMFSVTQMIMIFEQFYCRFRSAPEALMLNNIASKWPCGLLNSLTMSFRSDASRLLRSDLTWKPIF